MDPNKLHILQLVDMYSKCLSICRLPFCLSLIFPQPLPFILKLNNKWARNYAMHFMDIVIFIYHQKSSHIDIILPRYRDFPCGSAGEESTY